MDLRKLRITLFNWEYWPPNFFYFPVYVYIFILGLRLRNFYFFSAANPAIEFGGIAGERKDALQIKLPTNFCPKSSLIPMGTSIKTLFSTLQDEFEFPVVVKPNQGEQGKCVQIIKSSSELEKYHEVANFDYLLQEYIPFPKEYNVMLYINPVTKELQIGGVTIKEYLSITGDGESTLNELITKNDRSYLQKESLKKRWENQWNEILPNGEKLIINMIGNHCLGTTFLCGKHLIDDELKDTMKKIMRHLHKMYFVRFDIKCTSDDDFKAGKNLKILEVNGAGAEPTHMYDPKYSFWQAQKILFKHWTTVFRISKASIIAGNKPMNFVAFIAWRKEVRTYRKKFKI